MSELRRYYTADAAEQKPALVAAQALSDRVYIEAGPGAEKSTHAVRRAATRKGIKVAFRTQPNGDIRVWAR